jgi:hypothetical protein
MSVPHHFLTSAFKRFLLFVLLPSTFILSAEAQRTADLRITDVRFSKERSPIGGDSWLAMEIRVTITNNSDRTAANPEFIDDITLNVGIAHNLGSSTSPKLDYYWTQVEAATLKRGDHRFRFYLSPEQIERGRISTGEPYAWYIQATYGSAPSETAAASPAVLAVSDRLREPGRLERFQQLLEEQKESRAGILLPQIETPFRDMYASETPVLKGYKRGK